MAQIKADEITKLIREQIENYETKISVDETGTVITLGDGIARVYGLDKVMAGELLSFPHDVAGIAMNLEEDQVGVVLLGEYSHLRAGGEVKRTGRVVDVAVGDGLLGRVIDSLGQPLDGNGPVISSSVGGLITWTSPQKCPWPLPKSRNHRPPGHSSSTKFIGFSSPPMICDSCVIMFL